MIYLLKGKSMFIKKLMKKKSETHDEKILGTKLTENKMIEIIQSVKPYTMVPVGSQRFNIISALKSIKEKQKGVIVECGAWKGGSSVAILLAQKKAFGKVIKPVFMLDSFEGLPDAKKIDGDLALNWQADKDSLAYYDNCYANILEVKSTLKNFGLKEGEYYLIKGWFDDTVPKLGKKLIKEKIALLRLDGDWYDSTKVCLENLVPLVNSGSTVIIDDYYAWDGCAVAVNEYLGINKLPFRIRVIGDYLGAYFYTKGRESSNE